jgi:hypothetical protein
MAAVAAAIGGIAMPGPATAHEQRQVGDAGQFHFVVGFLNEPAVQGEVNAISVRISRNDPGATPAADGQVEREPVEGIEASLTFEIIYEDQTAELPVETVFRDPGHYVAYVIPTQPGVYSFRISGEIEGVQVEEVFTAGPETFSEVMPRADLEFPAPAE